MSPQRAKLHLATVTLLAFGLAFAAGCSSDHGNSAGNILGASVRSVRAENGLTLTADPVKIVINVADPATPTDPNHNNERYGETTLMVEATDPDGKAQPNLDVTFSATAGGLASGGASMKTGADGKATDKLRVYESDPGTIQVTVSDGTRTTTIDVTKAVASPPVANAGPDQTVECTGNSSAQVTLDGSASTDPDNDITLYEWFEHFGTAEQVLLDKGATAVVVLPLGEHTITLRVTDSNGLTSTDDVVVKVQDTTPPVVDLSVSPSRLWPPNHKMVDVEATLKVQECQPYTVTLVSVTSNEPENGLGDGDTPVDIDEADLGTADLEFDLRAERSGTGSGRVYTIVYRVTDAGGLATTKTATVKVPHDMSQR